MAKQTPLPHKSLLTRALAMAALLLSATAMTMAQDIKADTTAVKADTTAVKAKHGLVARLLQYFAESDKPKPDKKIDFGIIGGPHYASDTGLGLGLVASALYSTDRSDSTLEKSNASLYSDMTTKGFLMIGIRGNNIFPKKRYRLDYRIYVYTFPSYLWGFSYPQSDNDDNKSKYSRTKFEVMARFLIPINRYSYLGPIARYQYVHAYKLKDKAPQLLEGLPKTVSDFGVGVSYTFDSRDFMLNASRGWFMQLDLTTNPTFLGNNNTYWSAELQLATYRKAWRGAIIAGDSRQDRCRGPCSPTWGPATACAATMRDATATRTSSTHRWSCDSTSGTATASCCGSAQQRCSHATATCASAASCQTPAWATGGSLRRA